jgi:hypothetical protein
VARRAKILLAALGVLVFLAISALLARALSVDGAERSAIATLIEAEARGDAAAMLARMSGCTGRPACHRRVAADAAALRRAGAVSILTVDPSAGFSLGPTSGIARVAWKTPSSLPITQCIRVHRGGSVLRGYRVELLAISPRIATDGVCTDGAF